LAGQLRSSQADSSCIGGRTRCRRDGCLDTRNPCRDLDKFYNRSRPKSALWQPPPARSRAESG
jgi:hypothetical protein